MEGSLLEKLIKWLIIKQDYKPIRGVNGEFVVRSEQNILLKEKHQPITYVQVIDGNRCSLEIIRQRLENEDGFLVHLKEENIKASPYIIFVFETAEEEKLTFIKQWQERHLTDRNCFKCFVMDGKTSKVEKLFSRATPDNGLLKAISGFLDKKDELIWLSAPMEELIENKKKEYHIDFKVKNPIITYVLLTLNILVFVGLMAYSYASGKSYDELLITFGAKVNSYIIQGEYWRLFTPIFLHGGFIHLVVNCYSLYILGSLVERIFGRGKFLCSYLIAGIVGNMLSFMFVEGYSVGASGAIFGLMGMLLYYGIENPAQFKHYFGRSVLSTIGLNLVYGFSVSGIDNCAHLGGLVGGFLAIGALSKANVKRWYTSRIFYLLVLISLSVGAVGYGLTNDESQITRYLIELEQLEEEEDWENLELKGKEVYDMKPEKLNDRVSLLWALTKAELMQRKYDEAISYGQELAALSPINGHYLLGIIYYDSGQYSLAKGELQLALEAGNEAAGQMLDLIKQYEANIQ